MEDVAGHTTQSDRIRAAVEEVLQGTDLYLVDFDLRGRKGSQVLDVFVDADEGLDVNRLAEVSRELGFLLDTEDLISGRYNLNVSSPGADRPLVLPRQFTKHVGRTLQISYRPDASGGAASDDDGARQEEAETLVGELRAADADGIELALRGGETRCIPHAAITAARVQLPW